jgi:hypothetical protein
MIVTRMISMRSVGLMVAFSFGATGVAQTTTNKGGEWKNYKYPNAGFAVTFPHDPNPHNDPTMPEMTAYTVHFSSRAGLTLRVSSQTRDCAATLKQLRDGALSGKQPGLIAKSLKDVSVSGYPGIEWEFRAQPGVQQFERYVCAEGKFYFFAASWPSSEQKPQDLDRVLNSFKLLNPAR